MSDDGNAMRCWFASLLRNQSKVGLASLKIPDGTKETEKASTETSPLFFFFFPLLKISVNIFKERFAKREGTKSCVEWAGSQSFLAYGARGDKTMVGTGLLHSSVFPQHGVWAPVASTSRPGRGHAFKLWAPEVGFQAGAGRSQQHLHVVGTLSVRGDHSAFSQDILFQDSN